MGRGSDRSGAVAISSAPSRARRWLRHRWGYRCHSEERSETRLTGTTSDAADGHRADSVLGLVAAPRTASEVAAELALALPSRLASRFPGVSWRVDVVADPLVVSPAPDAEIIAAARELLLARGWDLAVCLTDLPLRAQRRPVVAHASASHAVALISLPALGPLRQRHRVTDAAVQMVARLLGAGDRTDDRVLGRRVERPVAETPDAGSVRFATRVLAGNVRLLLGMVTANHPWRLALGLSRALVVSLATVAFALVSRDMWLVGESLGVRRAKPVVDGSPVIRLATVRDMDRCRFQTEFTVPEVAPGSIRSELSCSTKAATDCSHGKVSPLRESRIETGRGRPVLGRGLHALE